MPIGLAGSWRGITQVKFGRMMLPVILLLSLCFSLPSLAQVETSAPVETSTQPSDEAAVEQPAPSPPVKINEAAAGIIADVPEDAALERAGARIGNIEIRVDDVFNPDDPKENHFLYRLANRLHINTRPETVRTQLLFASGEPYRRHALDETARILRTRNYLSEATIVPLFYHADDNTVDVLVRVHDVWTLETGASWGQSGGEQNSGFDLSEGNLLGWGKYLSLGYSNNSVRSTSDIEYRDQNLLSSRWVLKTRYADASDGSTQSLSVEHPFFSLDTHWAAGVSTLKEDRIDRVYRVSDVVDQYLTSHDKHVIYGGLSSGLHDGWVHRYSLGFEIERFHYTPDPVAGTLNLPQDQHLAYPWLEWSWLEDHYRTEFNRDLIGRTEDVYYGRAMTWRLGYSAPTFGGDDRAWLISGKWQNGYTLSPRQSLFVVFEATARREAGAWQSTLLTNTVRYDYRRSRYNMFTAKWKSDYGADLDQSQQLYLDADNGMRAYPLRYISGSQRNVLTLEQRFYSDYQLLRLLSVGAVAFVDVGRIDGEHSTDSAVKHTLADVGVGLRFGNIRSSGGQVFHVDVAYPLTEVVGQSRWQLNVRTLTSF